MKDVLKKLENDEHYYGEFGKQYLSNSDISTLLTNPLALGKQCFFSWWLFPHSYTGT
jgi:hypothetical protein